jgi:hypothetical protein
MSLSSRNLPVRSVNLLIYSHLRIDHHMRTILEVSRPIFRMHLTFFLEPYNTLITLCKQYRLCSFTQNYWVFWLCPSSGILKTREYKVSETGYISVLRWGGRHLLCWVLQKELTSITGRPMSKSFLYDWRFTSNQSFLASRPLRLTKRDSFFKWTLAGIDLM